MARLPFLTSWCALFAFASCDAIQRYQAPTIVDMRTDLERCPVHDDLLVEAVNRVDFERGSSWIQYHEIRRALFPAAFDDPHSVGEMAQVTYCPTCRAAKAKFARDTQGMSSDEFLSLDIDQFVQCQRQELDAQLSQPVRGETSSAR